MMVIAWGRATAYPPPWLRRLCRQPWNENQSDKDMKAALPKAQGLYDPQWEHDACGIGAVVNISGRRDHAIVEYGKQVLLNLMHRGAAGADESTGDGAGILLQIPHGFFRAQEAGLGFQLARSASTTAWRCCSCRKRRRSATAASRSSPSRWTRPV